MADDRYSKISEGAKQATGHYEFKKFWDMIKGLFPEKEEKAEVFQGVETPLAEEIAGVRRMVTDPESTSVDWDNVYQQWMEGEIDIEDMTDEQLINIYDELRGFEGQSPETMIEELTTYRDRMYR
jgi:hypothetical protein